MFVGQTDEQVVSITEKVGADRGSCLHGLGAWKLGGLEAHSKLPSLQALKLPSFRASSGR
jgi:hypothetical protein